MGAFCVNTRIFGLFRGVLVATICSLGFFGSNFALYCGAYGGRYNAYTWVGHLGQYNGGPLGATCGHRFAIGLGVDTRWYRLFGVSRPVIPCALNRGTYALDGNGRDHGLQLRVDQRTKVQRYFCVTFTKSIIRDGPCDLIVFNCGNAYFAGLYCG